MGRRRDRLHPPQRFHRRVLRGDACGRRTAAPGRRPERAHSRLPLERRRHHAGGGQDSGDVRPQGHGGAEHQRAFGGFETDVPHRLGTHTPRPAAGRARQRQFGLGGRNRRRSPARPRPRGADRPAQLRQGTRAGDPPAGLQHHAETHDGKILHPLGPLHPGHRLLPLAGGFGARDPRLAHLGVLDQGGPQGL